MCLRHHLPDLTATVHEKDFLLTLPKAERDHNATIAVYSFFVCLLIHHLLSGIVCRIFTPVYSSLPWAVRMEWNSRVVSTIHSVVVTLLSAYSLLHEHALWEEKINNVGSVAGKVLAISTGYMLADSISMPIYWRKKELLTFWLHHGLAASCFTINFYYGYLQFFAVLRLLSELSTPFLNFTWFARHAQLPKSSLSVMLNSLLLSNTYFLSRIVPIPFYWFWFLRISQGLPFRILLIKMTPIFLLWTASSVILDGLNVMWSRKIFLGGFRTLKNGLADRGLLSKLERLKYY